MFCQGNKIIPRFWRFLLPVTFACLILSGTIACSNDDTYEERLDDITEPFTFSTLDWEARNLFKRPAPPADITTVRHYFTLAGQQNSFSVPNEAIDQELSRLSPAVESAITQQIEAVLISEGLLPSRDSFNFTIPPVYFRLTEAPHILAISPRNTISLMHQIMLNPDINEFEISMIEDNVTRLNVSAQIEQLGGYGAIYPTCVSLTSNIEFTIETAVHEWVHQYLAFKPLGFRYVLDGLGIKKDYDVVTINETVSGIVSQEIASIILRNYYPEPASVQATFTATTFDFNVEMQNIRRQVDAYLAAGKIETAESYMEEKRQFLITKGYYIRKLNQAYLCRQPDIC
jgi:hypothetical protein